MNRSFLAVALATLLHLNLGASGMPTRYEQQIIKAALVLEAANQGERGMEAVLHVFITRADGDPGRVISEIARHGAVSSFLSVTAQRHPDYGPVIGRAMRDRVGWARASAVVERFMNGTLGPDPTGGADHYDCGHPAWSRSMTLTAVIGDHYFFKSG